MTNIATLPKEDSHALIEWLGQALYNHETTLAVESGDVAGNFHAPTVLTVRLNDANGHIFDWLRKRKISQQAGGTHAPQGKSK